MNNPSAPPLPDAVIFDMDGLMLDTEIIYHRAWQNAAADFGYHVDDEFFHSLIGIRTEECEEMIRATLDDAFPLDAFRLRWPQRWQEIVEIESIVRKPGLLELLDLLEERGIPKAVATSSTQAEAEYSLTITQLRTRFPVVVSGDQVLHGKPAPDIFLAAARQLGVDPTHCMAFEDSSAGAIAASAAGMRTYMVPDLVQPSTEARAQATVLNSLHQALALFE
jgi:HAD superfamily hydrolase (TIGR01509 family)